MSSKEHDAIPRTTVQYEISLIPTALGRLTAIRDRFSNEIPSEKVDSTQPDTLFKVSRFVWSGVIGDLWLAIEDKEVTNLEIIKKVEYFMDYYTSERFIRQPWTLPEDIQRMDDIINLACGEMSLEDYSTRNHFPE